VQEDQTVCLKAINMEPLAIAGGIASFGQILNGFIKTVDVLSDLLQTCKDATAELLRINVQISSFRAAVITTESLLSDMCDADALPPDLSTVLTMTFSQVQHDLQLVALGVTKYGYSSHHSFRQRLKFATIGKRSIDRLLRHLASSERNMGSIVNLLQL
jgi:hypothetical protein